MIDGGGLTPVDIFELLFSERERASYSSLRIRGSTTVFKQWTNVHTASLDGSSLCNDPVTLEEPHIIKHVDRLR